MGYALGGGSGWVLLTHIPRDGRLINQYAAEHSQSVASGVPILALDMYVSRGQDIAEGIEWRDPELIQQWIGELSKADPVVVYCSYGFHIGCKTAIRLRDAGFDAKYMNSGHSGWRAIGHPIKTNP
jgi:Fe-Mn family superoxide dismutase